jgi:hypothetical protein
MEAPLAKVAFHAPHWGRTVIVGDVDVLPPFSAVGQWPRSPERLRWIVGATAVPKVSGSAEASLDVHFPGSLAYGWSFSQRVGRESGPFSAGESIDLLGAGEPGGR